MLCTIQRGSVVVLLLRAALLLGLPPVALFGFGVPMMLPLIPAPLVSFALDGSVGFCTPLPLLNGGLRRLPSLLWWPTALLARCLFLLLWPLPPFFEALRCRANA